MGTPQTPLQHDLARSETPRSSLETAERSELKQRITSGGTWHIDYYALIGLRRGCSRSELERAHLLLSLKHKPNRVLDFLDKCEFEEGCDFDSIKDRAKMLGLLLYRLLQKAYASVMSTVMDEEAAEKQRKQVTAALQAEQAAVQSPKKREPKPETESFRATMAATMSKCSVPKPRYKITLQMVWFGKLPRKKSQSHKNVVGDRAVGDLEDSDLLMH